MKTKQSSVVLVVFAMTLSLIAPSFLSASVSADTVIGVGTGVTVPEGGGQIPVIKAKWEQDYSQVLEDGDPAHIIPGSQFLPTCNYQAYEPIKYCVVVTDEEDNGNVQQAWVDVYHPVNSWDNGSFKYEVPLTMVTDKQTSINLVTDAYNAGLIAFNRAYTLTDVLFELNKSTAKVWCGDGELYYEQPAGIYTVKAGALDFNSNPSLPLENTFEYVPTTCFAVDNDAINYGSVRVGNMKVVAGDTIFSINDSMMTVRNLGNTYMQVTALQNDMGFGKDINGMWNVEFDGRVGHVVDSITYQPFEVATLPGLLPHSTDDEIDFSIHLKKATRTGNYGGTMTLGSVIVDWCNVPGANCIGG